MTKNNKNLELESDKSIYLMGICGTGMAALAGLLVEKGFKVVGSDAGCYPPMDSVLKELKIPIHLGYDKKNIKIENPELVIIGNVIRKDNPEARFVLNSGIPYMSFPQALGEFFLKDKKPLVVSGTHGKTTTSCLLVSAIKECEQEPGFMIGGVPLDEKRGFKIGKSEYFIVEGDEYDSSFFQKISKFLFYRPFGAIITSIEFDHADIFSSLEEIKTSFKEFASLVPEDGCLAICSDWEDVIDVTQKAKAKLITYGLNQNADWQAKDIKVEDKHTSFLAVYKNDIYEIKINLPGVHNALNALSVVALCHGLGLDLKKVVKGLSKCKGAKRRQEIRGKVKDIVVIDDFAHHPRAVKETLAALKARFSDKRIIAVFEPRTNTSRRAIFQDVYPLSFDNADMVLVREVPEPEKFPKDNRFSSKKLVSDLNKRGVSSFYFKNAKEIIKFAQKEAKRGDIFVVLSNGPFEGIHEGLLEAIRDRDDL